MSETDRKLPLQPATPFAPLPAGSAHYVPTLQNKPGELEALARASTETWSRLTPLLQIVGPKGKKPISAQAVSNWMKKVAAAVGNHAFFLDILRVTATHPVVASSKQVPVLERIYWAARRRALTFVPVVPLAHATKRHLELVGSAVAEDGRGAALRYPIRSLALPGSESQAGYLSRVLGAIDVSPEHADLIVDLGFLDPDVELHPDELQKALDGALAVGAWRSVVLLGTSMPSMLSCVPEGSVGTLTRQEWEIWCSVAQTRGAAAPSYGDYAIQNPSPPQDSGGPTMRANIRYTTADATVIARGRGAVVLEGKAQYVALCQQISGRQDFSGHDYSWGDAVIDDCAVGRREPGSQHLWRGAGTSHHLRFVTDQLLNGQRAA